MNTSIKRSLRGARIIHSNERYGNNNDNIGDVLLDLLHYARQNGKDFEAELTFARKALKEDIEQEEKEANGK